MLFELPPFEHVDAEKVEDVLLWLRTDREKATVVAGATDLLGLMKDRIEGPALKTPAVLINIKTIPVLNRILYDESAGLRIGAAVRLNDLITSDVITERFRILSQAARLVGTTPLRNMGTLGGNLCQRPRCLYFRHPHFICFKKGGNRCYAVAGEHRHYHSILQNGRCVAAHPSDMASALVALNAKAIITCSDGERELPLQNFFSGPNDLLETVLKYDEFLKEIHIPNQKGKTGQVFLKQRIRHSADFALSSVATVARISDETCEDIRIVLGGVAPFPYAASLAEKTVKGRSLSERLISEAAEASVEGARPLPMNQYKLDLTKALVRRALTFLWRGDTQSGEHS